MAMLHLLHRRTSMKAIVRAAIIAPLLATLSAAVTSAGTVDGMLQAGPPPSPDGTVTINGGVVAIGVGYLWGKGTLNYQGQQLTFHIRGASLGDVGIAKITAQGLVYKLGCLGDFEGTYVAASTGAAIAVGESAAVTENKRGVVIELESKVRGLRFNIAASRFTLTLSKRATPDAACD